MSAFLFRRRHEAIQNDSTENLEKDIIRLEEALKDIKWETLEQCTFSFDQAYGFAATLEMTKRELENRKNGTNNSIRISVPGYNPGDCK